MFDLIIFGPPGSGKGTQSEMLVKKYQLYHLSTGDLLRAEIKAGSKCGKEAQVLMDRGELVPDEVVIEIIENKLQELKNTGILFDGFPRTKSQAQSLDNALAKYGRHIKTLVALEVPQEDLIKRILERGKSSGRVDDQDPKIIHTRIQEYKTKTQNVSDYYKDQQIFHPITGVGSTKKIFEEICKLLG